MTLSSYDTVIEDSAREARGREQQALNHGIALLKRFQSGDIPSSDGAEACSTFGGSGRSSSRISRSPRNGLPEKLRADIISIGLWIVREADRIRQQGSTDVAELVAINTVIRDALA